MTTMVTDSSLLQYVKLDGHDQPSNFHVPVLWLLLGRGALTGQAFQEV